MEVVHLLAPGEDVAETRRLDVRLEGGGPGRAELVAIHVGAGGTQMATAVPLGATSMVPASKPAPAESDTTSGKARSLDLDQELGQQPSAPLRMFEPQPVSPGQHLEPPVG